MAICVCCFVVATFERGFAWCVLWAVLLLPWFVLFDCLTCFTCMFAVVCFGDAGGFDDLVGCMLLW